MSYTDPSGYFFSWIGDAFDSLFKGIHDALGDLAPFAMAIVAVLNPGALLFNNPVSQAVFNGFIGEGIASGSFRGALTGAVSTLAFFDIGQHFKAKFGVDSFFELDGLGQQLEWVGAHALAGGILSQMRGGEFGHGFISAGIQKLASPYVLNTLGIDPANEDDQFAAGLVGAAIGGTASVATGGKFSNGAKTGFYQTLFNAGGRRLSKIARAVRSATYGAKSIAIERLLYAQDLVFKGYDAKTAIKMAEKIFPSASKAVRYITDKAGRTLDIDFLKGLKDSGNILKVSRNGKGRPLTGQPNTYTRTDGGHIIVFGSDGRRIMDISSKRIKFTEWNKGKNGQYYPREGNTTKFDGDVPDQVLKIFNLKVKQ